MDELNDPDAPSGAAAVYLVAAVVIVLIVAGCAAGGEPAMTDTNPRLRDIMLLLLFAVLLRIAETFDRDMPGWWLEHQTKEID